MKYDEIRRLLDTGDIVLFSGHGFFSNQIKDITNSPWSHVGMVYKIPEYDMLLLFESTKIGNCKDVEDGLEKKGVQTVFLSDKIKDYDGEVAIRTLSHKPNFSQRRILSDFRHTVKDLPYEKDKLELIKSAYDGWGGKNTEDLSSLFCSELVAESLQVMGYLDRMKPSNEYTPADFSKIVTLKHGELLPIVYVKRC